MFPDPLEPLDPLEPEFASNLLSRENMRLWKMSQFGALPKKTLNTPLT